jgi:hypothetical protein
VRGEVLLLSVIDRVSASVLHSIQSIAYLVDNVILDHIAEMDADPKFNALVGRDPDVALDHRPLDFNGAVHCVDDTPELDDAAVAGALDDPTVVHGDGRIDQVAP